MAREVVYRAVRLSTVPGHYAAVTQDGESHIVDMEDWPDEIPVWLLTPVCGKAVPVGADCHADTPIIDCLHCIGIVF